MSSSIANSSSYRTKIVEARLFVGTALTLIAAYMVMILSPKGMGLGLPLVVGTTYMNNFFIWTTLTCAFTETSILKLLLDLALLGWVVRRFGPFEDLLEPVRLAALTVVAAIASSLCTSVLIFLGFVITRWENLFFSPTYGYGPVLMAYLVLLAQRLPSEAVFSSLPSLCGGTNRTLRVQHLPFTWLCLSASLHLLLPIQTASGAGIAMDLPLVACSFVLSWAYLRFFAHNRDGTVGDTSDDFQLVKLFPRVLGPYLGPLFNFCYGVWTLCGQCKERELAMASTLIAEEESLFLGRLDTLSGSGSKTKQQHHQHQQQSQKPKGEPLLVGGAPHKVDPVAERRKAKALRVLETRLQKMADVGANASKLRVGGKDQEADLEASTAQV